MPCLNRTRYLYLVREEEEEEGTSQTRFSVVKRLEGPFSTFSMPTTEWLLNNEVRKAVIFFYFCFDVPIPPPFQQHPVRPDHHGYI